MYLTFQGFADASHKSSKKKKKNNGCHLVGMHCARRRKCTAYRVLSYCYSPKSSVWLSCFIIIHSLINLATCILLGRCCLESSTVHHRCAGRR